MLTIAGLFFVGWILFWCYGMWQMITEQHYYYWKLIAVRHSTDSETLKFVKVAAMIDFQNEIGPGWKVTYQVLSEKYFKMRTHVQKRDDARLAAMCNGERV